MTLTEKQVRKIAKEEILKFAELKALGNVKAIEDYFSEDGLLPSQNKSPLQKKTS
jgi:hypothetical protein